MARAFPTQITRYLAQVFKTPAALSTAVQSSASSVATCQSSIGAISGFLRLYDQIPEQLFVLSEPDYASLVGEIETVRFGLDQFRNGTHPDCLMRVGPALVKAWQLVAKLPDNVPSSAHDLSFISDPDLQRMIGIDISAISTDLQSGEWKSATLLAGSCCEALLLYGLQTRDAKAPGAVAGAVGALKWRGKAPNSANLTDASWDLFSYAAVARHLGLISANTKSELDPARDYRNLIHPAKAIRDKVSFDHGTAYVGAGAVDHVVADLKKNLP